MKVKIISGNLNGELTIIPSKSYWHRILIAQFLSNKLPVVTKGAVDIMTTYQVLSALKSHQDTFYFNDSASTLRFLIPLISIMVNKKVTLVLGDSLTKRPLDSYYKIFNEQGLLLSLNGNILTLEGKLKPGDYFVDADISSQFVTGLLMALPLLKGDSKIILNQELVSKDYIAITLDVLKQFGIEIKQIGNIFYVAGNQQYHYFDMPIEGDFSQGAFFLAAGALNQEIRIKGLPISSLQGDKRIIDIINKMGGYVFYEDNVLVSKQGDLHGSVIDLADNIDLGPVLLAIAATINDKTIFKNVDRLKYKEADRLMAMVENLTKLGAKITIIDESTIIVEGKEILHGNMELAVFNDHRIAMALAIIKSRIMGDIILDNMESVNKSYKEFFLVFQKLGGKIKC